MYYIIDINVESNYNYQTNDYKTCLWNVVWYKYNAAENENTQVEVP